VKSWIFSYSTGTSPATRRRYFSAASDDRNACRNRANSANSFG
jgi:hypothetical protein